MVAYYGCLMAIGIASMWGGEIAATLGIGYAVLGGLGIRYRVRQQHSDESVIMVAPLMMWEHSQLLRRA